MYINRRCAPSHISNDSVMRDTTMITRDMRISVLRTDTSQMRISHVVGKYRQKIAGGPSGRRL
jgi:phenylalanyl-tRNA synthetase alpha subunit